MTPHEVLAQMDGDHDEVIRANYRYVMTGGCDQARKCLRFPVYMMHEMKTSTGNRYIVMNVFDSKRDAMIHSYHSIYHAVVDTESGRVVISKKVATDGLGEDCVFYFMPHLFKRYKERIGFEFDGMQLIRTFLKRNEEFIYHENYRRSKDNMDDVMYSCVDGAIFGTRHPQHKESIIFKTFISTETMQEGYKSEFSETFNESLISEAIRLHSTMPEMKFIKIRGKQQKQ